MYNLRLKYPKADPMNLIAKLLMNSLYGKFGMRMENTIIEIFNTSIKKDVELLDAMVEEYGPTIKDLIKIGKHYLTIRKSILNCIYTDNDDTFHGLDVNIAIASAISAGGRMWMSTIKNCEHPNSLLKGFPKFNIYYSDTDSVVTDAPLPSFMVGKDLGKFKLEHTILKGVFLAPKVYGLITTEGNEIIKIKGLSKDSLDNINFNNLELLLHKDSSLEFSQTKWFKKLIEGEITVNEVAYTLKVTSNKRQPIYIDNIFTATKPYNYDDITSDD
jgi:hypothetical protein